MGDRMKLGIPRTIAFLMFASAFPTSSFQRLLLRFLRIVLSMAQVPVGTLLAGCPFCFVTSVI